MTLFQTIHSKKAPSRLHITPRCRRCGDTSCQCSDEDIDAGGPA